VLHQMNGFGQRQYRVLGVLLQNGIEEQFPNLIGDGFSARPPGGCGYGVIGGSAVYAVGVAVAEGVGCRAVHFEGGEVVDVVVEEGGGEGALDFGGGAAWGGGEHEFFEFGLGGFWGVAWREEVQGVDG